MFVKVPQAVLLSRCSSSIEYGVTAASPPPPPIGLSNATPSYGSVHVDVQKVKNPRQRTAALLHNPARPRVAGQPTGRAPLLLAGVSAAHRQCRCLACRANAATGGDGWAGPTRLKHPGRRRPGQRSRTDNCLIDILTLDRSIDVSTYSGQMILRHNGKDYTRIPSTHVHLQCVQRALSHHRGRYEPVSRSLASTGDHL